MYKGGDLNRLITCMEQVVSIYIKLFIATYQLNIFISHRTVKRGRILLHREKLNDVHADVNEAKIDLIK